jgi:hypothetical protein
VIWLFVVLAALTTFVIAAVSVGSTTAGLAGRSRRTVYDLEDAVDHVAARLPAEVTAQESFEDVRAVLTWYVDYLAGKGIASPATADDPGSGLIVVGDDERLAYVLGRVDAAASDDPGAGLDDEQVAAILEANLDYERSIGAIGPEVPPPTLDAD